MANRAIGNVGLLRELHERRQFPVSRQYRRNDGEGPDQGVNYVTWFLRLVGSPDISIGQGL